MNAQEAFARETPCKLGYRMPAEWEKHDATWIAWPYDPTTFPYRVEKAEHTYVQIVKLIHEDEIVNLFVKDAYTEHKAISMFREEKIDLSRVCFHRFDYADVWFRDYGPTFVVDSKPSLAIVHWIFNSWGRKYPELLKDRRIVGCINQKMCLPCFEPRIVLEGGSIDVNGEGTVLTTEQCLLNKNRNPQLNKNEIEVYLKNYLSVSNVVWLKNGVAGDDTDGHVDDIARFVNPSTVVCAFEKNESDENYTALRENYEILLKSKDQNGKKLKVVKLPVPFVVGDNRERLPASYANFYIGNKTVLVPIFEKKTDRQALSILKEQFPDRKVAGINCTDLVYGLGTIHCITQQQPSTLQPCEIRE